MTGTTSLAICYAISILVGLVTPVIGHKIGCKRLLMLGVVGFLVHVLANAYSGNNFFSFFSLTRVILYTFSIGFATLVPGGFFLGLGEAWVWTALPIITTYYAKQQRKEKESFERHIRRFTGYYIAITELSTVTLNNGQCMKT